MTISLIIAIGIVCAIVVLQISSYKSTKKKIMSLLNFFSNVSFLEIIKTKVSKDDLNSKAALERISSHPQQMFDDEEVDLEEYQIASLIRQNKSGNEHFGEVIRQTNAYLCKNVGTSADLGVLEDICKRKIDSIENEISSTLNVPLYLGLGGTFLGIIFGVLGISNNIGELFNSKDMTSLQNLLIGVGIAMIASFIGLLLMVLNSAINYKKAVAKVDENKGSYYDFLRRELVPTLSNSMASSLNSLRGVLGHFVDKFGRNLDAYADSAQLLNDNLEKQHLVLAEINKLGVAKTAKTINETFMNLKESSNALNAFVEYQKGLNGTIEKVDNSVKRIEDIIANFKSFTKGLEIVIKNQEQAAHLQQQFRESIEQNFPTGSEAREAWRKQFDALVEDAKIVTDNLNQQLSSSTEYIRDFVAGNKEVFESMGKQQELITRLIEYTEIQGKCYSDLREEIESMKNEQLKAQEQTAGLNKDLITAVKDMTAAIKILKSK